jgi:hypothetical protein
VPGARSRDLLARNDENLRRRRHLGDLGGGADFAAAPDAVSEPCASAILAAAVASGSAAALRSSVMRSVIGMSSSQAKFS